MRIGAMIKARLGSSRFPRKHIHKLWDTTMIQQIIRKAVFLEGLSHVIIETSTEEEDAYFMEIADREGVECFRGDPVNLFERDTNCMKRYGLTHGLMISGDCPMFDPVIAQRLIDAVHLDPRHESYSPISTYHKPMGGTTSAIHSYKYIMRYQVPLYSHPNSSSMWEQYWVLPLDDIDAVTVDCDDIMPIQWTPIETSVDYPLQLAVLNCVCDYLGHFPKDYSEVAQAFRDIYALAIVPWSGDGA